MTTFLYKEGSTQAQEDEAKQILEALSIAYPGHPWGVRVYPGGFFIRHLDFPSNYGMNCKGSYASASLMKRDVILKAGEWLERAGLRRGHWNEEETKKVEGVPDRFQPLEYRRELDQKNAAAVLEVVREFQNATKEKEHGEENGFPSTS